MTEKDLYEALYWLEVQKANAIHSYEDIRKIIIIFDYGIRATTNYESHKDAYEDLREKVKKGKLKEVEIGK